jgi:hypothetical protein
MPPRRSIVLPSNERDIQLAISAIDANQIRSNRRAAAIFNVPESTLRDRRAGKPSRRDSQPNSKKLTLEEEQVIVEHILDLDKRGFPPRYMDVRDMADKLLAARNSGQVGVHWARNFVKRTDDLRTSFTRSYDRQRALCEDPVLVSDWFKLVAQTKTTYGILDEDVFNFDEASFTIGKIGTQPGVTGSEKRGRPKSVQPCNRECVTVIAAINAAGWTIPPFLIFAGDYHLSAWYEEESIPRDWVIAVSPNGWTTNEIGVAWLKHFDAHTKTRTVGARRLLVLDGHESHHSLQFQEYCKENNIYTLCMPAHSSHLLQPLDVGCFSPLKRAYSREVDSLSRNHINHITTLEFLPAFSVAFEQSFTKSNICSAFHAAGLVPLQADVVLSRLDTQLRTPTPPPALVESILEARTPRNVREIEARSTLIRNRIQQHRNSSPTPITEALDQLKKEAEELVLSAKLMHDRIASLERKLMRQRQSESSARRSD